MDMDACAGHCQPTTTSAVLVPAMSLLCGRTSMRVCVCACITVFLPSIQRNWQRGVWCAGRHIRGEGRLNPTSVCCWLPPSLTGSSAVACGAKRGDSGQKSFGNMALRQQDPPSSKNLSWVVKAAPLPLSREASGWWQVGNNVTTRRMRPNRCKHILSEISATVTGHPQNPFFPPTLAKD
jgi:hypothetical protein